MGLSRTQVWGKKPNNPGMVTVLGWGSRKWNLLAGQHLFGELQPTREQKLRLSLASTHMNTHTHMCTCVLTHAHAHAQHTYTHMHVCMHVCTHTRTDAVVEVGSRQTVKALRCFPKESALLTGESPIYLQNICYFWLKISLRYGTLLLEPLEGR